MDQASKGQVERKIRTLEQLREIIGPEIISEALEAWARAHGVRLQFIQPGKPTQNAFIERFNRSYRNEALDAYLFDTLEDVRAITRDWLWRYNHRRTQDSLETLRAARWNVRLPAG
jgi:putative transposase